MVKTRSSKKRTKKEAASEALSKAQECELLRISTLLLLIIDNLTLYEFVTFDNSLTNKIIRYQYKGLITNRYCPYGLNVYLHNRVSLSYCLKNFYCKDLIALNFKFGVEDNDISNILTSSLLPLNNIETLHFTYCDLLSDNIISNIIQGCPNVTAIDLSGALNTGTRTISVLSTITVAKNLEELHLSQIKNISNFSVNNILQSAYKLRILNLSWTFGVSDAVLVTIGNKLKLLQVLLMISQHDISEIGVRNLCDTIITLKEIHLDYCRQISIRFINELKDKGIKASV